MFHISTWIEWGLVEDNFLIHSGHEYKILFYNKLYISPHPKFAIFINHVSYKRQLYGLALW